MSTPLINIRNTQDTHARYRMPDLEFRTKHNLTYITNLKKISKSLHVDHLALAKYLGLAFSTMSKYSEKNRELQINGLHEKESVMKQIRKFIQEYVLCPTCDLPELDYIPKKKALGVCCQACGWRGKCDLNDRVLKAIHQYELTRPKKKSMKPRIATKLENEKGKSKDTNKDTRKTKSQPEEEVGFQFEGDFSDLPELPDEDEVVWETDLSAEAVEARRETILTSAALKNLF